MIPVGPFQLRPFCGSGGTNAGPTVMFPLSLCLWRCPGRSCLGFTEHPWAIYSIIELLLPNFAITSKAVWLPPTISGVPRRAVIHPNRISHGQGVRVELELGACREQRAGLLPGWVGVLLGDRAWLAFTAIIYLVWLQKNQLTR